MLWRQTKQLITDESRSQQTK